MQKSLSKSEFSKKLGEKAGTTAKEAGRILGILALLVQEEIEAGRPVVLPDLIRLKISQTPAKAARKGVNPITKAVMDLPAKPASAKVKALVPKALASKAEKHAGSDWLS